MPENPATRSVDIGLLRESAESTWPMPHGSRPWGPLSMVAVGAVLSIASWIFSMGGALSYWLPAKQGLLVLFGGILLALFFVTLAVVPVSVKYGLDTATSTVPQFGVRGTFLTTLFMWWVIVVFNALIMILLGGTAAKAMQLSGWIGDSAVTPVRIAISCVAVVITYLFVARGAKMVRDSSNWIAVALAALSVLILVITLVKFGWHDISTAKPSAPSGSKQLDFQLALEYMVVTSFTWWPYVGAMTRMGSNVSKGTHGVFWGLGVALCATTVSPYFAALVTGDPDPTGSLTKLSGVWFAWVSVFFLLLANVGCGIVAVYAGGVGLKALPLRWVKRMKWKVMAAIVLLPSAGLAFFPNWYLSHQATWFFLTGMAPVSFCAIQIVDYYFFRRKRIDLKAVFDESPQGAYAYWGGVNWVAVLSVGVGLAVYLLLLNPGTFAAHAGFKWVGASIPSLLSSGTVYAALTVLVTMPLKKGGYERKASAPRSAPVGELEPNPNEN